MESNTLTQQKTVFHFKLITFCLESLLRVQLIFNQLFCTFLLSHRPLLSVIVAVDVVQAAGQLQAGYAVMVHPVGTEGMCLDGIERIKLQPPTEPESRRARGEERRAILPARLEQTYDSSVLRWEREGASQSTQDRTEA